MTWRKVANVEAFDGSDKILVSVEGKEIGLIRADGSVYAVLNACPHQHGPVCRGGLFDYIDARVEPDGSVTEFFGSRGDVLACPWHGWEYDLKSGQCLWNRRFRLRKYEVRVEPNGDICLAL